MDSLPSVLDIEDALRRARDDADEDIGDDVESVEARLDAMATDRDTDREATLDEIENTLLRIEERVDGDAERDVRAARNRINIYRDARESGTEGGEDSPFVIDSEHRGAEDGDPDAAAFTATVVNEGDARDVRAVVTFYDEDDAAIEEVASDEVRVGEDEQTTIEFEATPPVRASYYAITTREASGHEDHERR